MRMVTLNNMHSHTCFSVLDGCVTVENMVKKAVEIEMPALSITDHGTMSGALSFYQECKKKGIKPIIGCEMYLNDERSLNERGYSHIILLAKNYKGYLNLMRIVSEANINGFYYRPRTTTEIVFKYSEGLIVSTACIGGLLGFKKPKERVQIAKKWKDKFGEDFYIELQVNEMPIQKTFNTVLLDLANVLGIEPLITLDSHYANPGDIAYQDFILAVRNNKTMKDKTLKTYDARNLYLMDAKQLWKNTEKWGHRITKKQFKRMCKNSVEIADKCDLEIPLGGTYIPKSGTTKEGFTRLVTITAKNMGLLKKRVYRDRLKEELRVIHKLGYYDYFMIVFDLVFWCRENGIFVGPARGSAAGSLVSYILGITKIDPIVHNLLFERFLTIDRVDAPDIDIDICSNRRDEIFPYLSKKYGKNKVVKVGTFGTFGKVGALRDIARVFEMPVNPINEIANEVYKVGATEKDALQQAYNNLSGTMKDFWRRNKKWIKFANNASELIRNSGVHPCGIIVAPKPVYKYCPLEKRKGEIVTGYIDGSRRELSDIGLIKLDVLGLNTCSIISDTVDLVEKHSKEDLSEKIWNINLKDKKLIKEAQKGNTTGGFQFETNSAISILKKIKPVSFEEIAAINAINRPGPLGSGAVEKFMYREGMGINNEEVEAILEDTRGVLVYQEQVMKIFHWAGYTLTEADRHRKLAAKKLYKDGDIKKLKKEFVKKASKKIDKDDAKELFKTILAFTKYSFNKSHSVAYSYLFFQVLYLKNYYPVEFFCALLSNTSTATIKDTKKGTEQNKLNRYIGEARRYKVKIFPPSINNSGIGFSIADGGIRFGLDKIKTIKGPTAAEIIEKQPFKSFNDFLKRVTGKVHKGKIVNLIKAGAFDCIDKRQVIMRQFNSVKKEQIFNLKARNIIGDAIDAFGFVLYHPFFDEEVKEYLISNMCSSSHQIAKRNRWDSVTVAGIITDVQKRSKGKSTKVVKIQDHRGEMAIYLNKETESKYSRMLKVYKIILVRGKISNNNMIICHSNGSIVDITDKVEVKMGGEATQAGGLL